MRTCLQRILADLLNHAVNCQRINSWYGVSYTSHLSLRKIRGIVGAWSCSQCESGTGTGWGTAWNHCKWYHLMGIETVLLVYRYIRTAFDDTRRENRASLLKPDWMQQMANWTWSAYQGNCPSLTTKWMDCPHHSTQLPSVSPAIQPHCMSSWSETHVRERGLGLLRWTTDLTTWIIPWWNSGQIAGCQDFGCINSDAFSGSFSTVCHPKNHYKRGPSKRGPKAQWTSTHNMADCHGPI